MTDDIDERVLAALETIGSSLARLAKAYEERLAKEHPPAKIPREAVISKIPDEEERTREEQGASDEPIEEWVGLREAEFDRGR